MFPLGVYSDCNFNLHSFMVIWNTPTVLRDDFEHIICNRWWHDSNFTCFKKKIYYLLYIRAFLILPGSHLNEVENTWKCMYVTDSFFLSTNEELWRQLENMQYVTKQKPNNMRITRFTKSVAVLNKKGMMADGGKCGVPIHLQWGPVFF